MGRHNSFSTLEQKIQWLLKHRNFLVGKTNKHRCVLAMKHDGLVSKITYWPDVNIDEALKQAKLRWYAEHNGPIRAEKYTSVEGDF